MTPEHYQQGEEPRGLARLLPTTLAKSLLIAVFSVPFLIFQIVRGNPMWFGLQTKSGFEQTLIALVAASIISWILLFILSIDLCLIIANIKHRYIYHYSTRHPQMTFRWFASNASTRHYFTALGSIVLAFILGFYLGRT